MTIRSQNYSKNQALFTFLIFPYPWHDEPYRSHIKIMARLCHLHFNSSIYGTYFEPKIFKAVNTGEMLFPEALSEAGHHHCSWNPEDNGLDVMESCVAKETENFPQVLK